MLDVKPLIYTVLILALLPALATAQTITLDTTFTEDTTILLDLQNTTSLTLTGSHAGDNTTATIHTSQGTKRVASIHGTIDFQDICAQTCELEPLSIHGLQLAINGELHLERIDYTTAEQETQTTLTTQETPIGTQSVITDTRYMRSDTQEINSLNTYTLGTSQSASALTELIEITGNSNDNGVVTWGVRVWKRSEAGTETEITSGTPVAQVSRSAEGEGLQSALWTPPLTTLDPEDSIVVRVYAQITGASTDIPWTQQAAFTTDQLVAKNLQSNQWTIHYYTEYATQGGQQAGRFTRGWYSWGDASVNSRIEGFSYEEALPVVTITSPTDPLYQIQDLDLNYTVDEAQACWYSTDQGTTNSSSVSPGTNFLSLTPEIGENTWTVYCNNTIGLVGSDLTTFEVTPHIDITRITPISNEEVAQNNSVLVQLNVTCTGGDCGDVDVGIESDSDLNEQAISLSGSGWVNTTSTFGSFGSQNMGNFSLELWFRTNVTDERMRMAGISHSTSDTRLQLGWNINTLYSLSAGSLYFEVYDDEGNYHIEASNSDTGFGDGEWHHLVVSYTGNEAKMFVDGSEISLVTLKSGVPNNFVDWDSPLLIGATTATNRPFKGDIDEFRLYNYSLGLPERTEYNTSSNVSNPNLVAYYRFENSSVAIDNTGNGHDGIYTGDVSFTSTTPWNTGTGYDTLNSSSNPFSVNSSNPQTINLSEGESQLVTFWINATGEINTTRTIQEKATWKQNPAAVSTTDTYTLTIVDFFDLELTNVYIDPAVPGTNNDLQGVCDTNKPNENINYSYTWYKDSVETSSGSVEKTSSGEGNVVSTILAQDTTVDETWIFSCQASTEEENTTWTNSTPINIYEDSSTFFKTRWKTDNTGVSNDDQITLPLEESGTYNFTIGWGDGTSDTITTWNQSEVTHTYASPGTYNVTIEGTLQGFRFNDGGDKLKILYVNQWGNMSLGNSGGYFYGASNLNILAEDAPDLVGTTDLSDAFRNTDLSIANNFNTWDTSGVTSLVATFSGSSFNSPIGLWDVSQVTSLQETFRDAVAFNQDLGSWNTSEVNTLQWTFWGANNFSQDLDDWDVSQVTNLRGTFNNEVFSGVVSSWNTSNVDRMDFTFFGNEFNHDLSGWDTRKVTTMREMFGQNSVFDQDISSWNVENVTNFQNFMSVNALSLDNYDNLLVSWSQQNLRSGIENDAFRAGNSEYTIIANQSRQQIIDTYNWSISDGGINPRPAVKSFDGETTDFGAVGDLSSVGAVLEMSAFGRVVWTNNVDARFQYYDRDVQFGSNWVFVNSSALHPSHNDSANVTIYGDFTNPIIQQDGVVCTTCEILNLNETQITFNVTSFSNYSVENNSAPTHDTPVLESELETNTTTENLIVSAQNLNDADEDDISLSYDWRVNGTSIALLNMPFNVNVSTTELGAVRDYSTYENHGTLGNGTLGSLPSWTSNGIAGGAYDFDGSNDVILVENLTELNNVTEMTVCSWVYLRDADALAGVVMREEDTNANGFAMQLGTTNDRALFSTASFDYGETDAGTLSTDTWEYWCSVYDGSGSSNADKVQFYLNAVEQNLTFTGSISSQLAEITANLSIGARSQPNSNPDRHLNGRIDEVLILNRSLSPEQIQQLYQEGNASLNNLSTNTSTLVSQETTVGENWTVAITPSDQYNDGTTKTSNQLTILESSIYTENSFVTTWKTDNPGTSNNNSISLPLESDGTYNFQIDWGDGNQDTITTWNQAETTHTYTTPGTYDVTIEGTLQGFRFNDGEDKLKILDVNQWGNMSLGNNGGYFWGANNLQVSANDTPDLSGTTYMRRAFDGANLSTANSFEDWDVSNVQDFRDFFSASCCFNENISGWNTSSMTEIASMFGDAKQFNQDLDQWDVSGVGEAGNSLYNVFFNADAFDGNISTWNTTGVTSMRRMFFTADMFSGDVSNWDVSSVTNFNLMFRSAGTTWNSDISGWNTSSATTMVEMFNGASHFNADISNWDVSNVTDMTSMFAAASLFDQDISKWNVSKVEDMTDLFKFGGAGLSRRNTDYVLHRWSTLSLQSNTPLHLGSSVYTIMGNISRQDIIDNYNWSINGGSLSPLPADYTFNGSSTNFSAVGDISSTPVTLENTTYGKISWQNINASYQYYDRDVQFGSNWVFVNITNLHPTHNSSANITIYGSYSDPVIKKDGALCTSCAILDTNSSQVTFNVTSFSNYSVENNTLAITFVPPTPENNSNVTNTALVNISINTSDLDTFTYNWDTTNYTLYDNSLVLHMNLNNNSALGETEGLVRDASRYANDGLINGSLTYVDGIYGKALDFPGSAAEVAIPHSDSLNISQDITISLWMRYESNSDPDLITKGAFDQSYSVWRWNNDAIRFALDDNRLTSPQGSIQPNQWYHVVALRDNTTRAIYIDGELVVSDTYSAAIGTTTDDLTLGTTEWPLDGQIDEVRIYNRGLSAEEIQQLYRGNLKKVTNTTWTYKINQTNIPRGTYTYQAFTNTSTGESTSTELRILNAQNNAPTHDTPILNSTLATNTTVENLTIHAQNLNDIDGDNISINYDWRVNGTSIALLNMPFNVNVSTTELGAVRDYSTYENHGTLGNGTLGSLPSWTSNGIAGGAYDFDGSTSITSSITNAELQDGFTFTAWIYPTSFGGGSGSDGFGRIIDKSNSTDADGGPIWYVNSVQDRIAFYIDASTPVQGNTNSITLNQWQHVAVTVQPNGTVQHYVNGSTAGSGITNSPSQITTSNPLTIGQRSTADDRGFDGKIDELHIYNRTLTQEQIKQIYAEGNASLNEASTNTSTIVRQETTVGEDWSVAVTPSDGIVDGETKVSNSLLVEPAQLPGIEFVDPTPQDNQSVPAFNLVINASIESEQLYEVQYTWDDLTYFLPLSTLALFYSGNASNDTISIQAHEDHFSLNKQDLVLAMNFDNRSELSENDSFIRDISGYGHHGTPTNAYVISDAVHQGGYEFLSDGYIAVDDNDLLDPREGSYTWTFWAKLYPDKTSGGNWDLLLGKRSANSVGYYIGANRDEGGANEAGWRLAIRKNSTERINTPYINTPLDEWVFVAAVLDRDANTQTIHINMDSSTSATPPAGNLSFNTQLGIGQDIDEYTAHPTHGAIDDLRMFNRSLSVQELEWIYYSSTNKLPQNTWNLEVQQDVAELREYTYQATAINQNGESNSTEARTLHAQNTPPTHSKPILNSSLGTNSDVENLTVYAQNVSDVDGDVVSVNYDWRLDGESVALLNMPFITNVSGVVEGAVRDYSSHNNSGTLGGGNVSRAPVWSSSGGGSYKFSGDQDVLMVDSEQLRVAHNNGEISYVVSYYYNGSSGDVLHRGRASSCEYEPRIRTDSVALSGCGNSGLSASFSSELGWNQVIFVISKSTDALRTYLNGVLVNETSIQTVNESGGGILDASSSASSKLVVGALNNIESFGGPIGYTDLVGGVLVFDRAISEDQVEQLYKEANQSFASLQQNSSTLVAEETVGDDLWSVLVTPSDSMDVGESKVSNSLRVLSTLPPGIEFVAPTPVNGSVPDGSALVNVSVDASSLELFSYFWDGRSYDLLNASSLIHLSFDNVSSLGENASVLFDASSYAHSFNVSGASYASGRFGSSLNFSDPSHRAEGNVSASSLQGGFSASAWINPASYGQSGYGRILDMGESTRGANGFLFWIIGDSVTSENTTVFYIDEGSIIYGAENAVSLNEWQHVAVTVDASGSVTLYRDGEVIGSGSTSAPSNIITSNPFTIGQRSGASDRGFDGLIDEVRVFDSVLSGDDIQQLYRSNLRRVEFSEWSFVSNHSNLQVQREYYFNATASTSFASNSTETRVLLSDTFSTRWKTDNPGSSSDSQITLPLESSGSYNFFVDWGDGFNDTITSWNDSAVTHTYSSPGTYTVNLTGVIDGWRFNNAGDAQKLLEVSRWGPLRFGNSGGYFYGASNLNVTALDAPDLSGTTTFENAFRGAGLSTASGFGSWNVSGVTVMDRAFGGSSFNEDLSAWDTSNVTSMYRMFLDAQQFNGNVSSWDTSQVTNMRQLFENTNFVGDVSSWDVSKVDNFRYTFRNAGDGFNADVSAWNTSSALSMYGMFRGNHDFDSDLSSWDVSGVSDFSFMFDQAQSFSANISSWDTSSAVSMRRMFFNANAFNTDISSWNVSQVTDMSGMFRSSSGFNQSLDAWDTSSVTDMSEMFNAATSFNQPLGSWNTSSVTDMSLLFRNTPFNQDISSWDVSNVTTMREMFSGASSFDQDLGSWNVSLVGNFSDWLSGGALSTANYDSLLMNWSLLSLQSSLSFHAGSSTYCDGESARSSIISSYGWSFTDGGLDSSCETPRVLLERLEPSSNVTVRRGESFEVVLNVSCVDADCGDVDASFFSQPAQFYWSAQEHVVGETPSEVWEVNDGFPTVLIQNDSEGENYLLLDDHLFQNNDLIRFLPSGESSDFEIFATIRSDDSSRAFGPAGHGKGWESGASSSDMDFVVLNTDNVDNPPDDKVNFYQLLEGSFTDLDFLYTSFNQSSKLHFRMRAEGSRVYGKIWEADASEPDEWMVSDEVSTSFGTHGIQSWKNSSLHVYEFAVGVNGSSAPSTSSSGGLIPVGSGLPFYMNQSNPRTVSLSVDESVLVTAWINATGDAYTNHTFFEFVNISSSPSTSNSTSEYVVSIVDSCVYLGSGDWVVDMRDNCVISEAVSVAGGLVLENTGNFTINNTVSVSGVSDLLDQQRILMASSGRILFS